MLKTLSLAALALGALLQFGAVATAQEAPGAEATYADIEATLGGVPTLVSDRSSPKIATIVPGAIFAASPPPCRNAPVVVT